VSLPAPAAVSRPDAGENAEMPEIPDVRCTA
jgi:hypothetical protein